MDNTLKVFYVTWTNFTTFSFYLHGVFAWVLVGTGEASALLKAISAGAQDALQNFAQYRVPHVTMGVGPPTICTSLDKKNKKIKNCEKVLASKTF